MAFSWSAIQSAESLEASRSIRFQPEWRPILLGYFGLAPGMRVLEVGCGPGTLAPYLAEGLAPGTVTGIDLDEDFIQRAEEKASRNGHHGVQYLVANAYELPFSNHRFDAAVSYTGMGVLADPRQAIREMLRVTRPGGSIAVAEAVTGPTGILFNGLDSLVCNEPYTGAARYWELRERLFRRLAQGGRSSGVGNPDWPPSALWGLMAQEGVIELRIHAWGYVTSDDDARLQDRTERLRQRFQAEQQWLDTLRIDPSWEHSLRVAEWKELDALLERRRGWLEFHHTFDWEAGLSIVMAGRKPI